MKWLTQWATFHNFLLQNITCGSPRRPLLPIPLRHKEKVVQYVCHFTQILGASYRKVVYHMSHFFSRWSLNAPKVAHQVGHFHTKTRFKHMKWLTQWATFHNFLLQNIISGSPRRPLLPIPLRHKEKVAQYVCHFTRILSASHRKVVYHMSHFFARWALNAPKVAHQVGHFRAKTRFNYRKWLTQWATSPNSFAPWRKSGSVRMPLSSDSRSSP